MSTRTPFRSCENLRFVRRPELLEAREPAERSDLLGLSGDDERGSARNVHGRRERPWEPVEAPVVHHVEVLVGDAGKADHERQDKSYRQARVQPQEHEEPGQEELDVQQHEEVEAPRRIAGQEPEHQVRRIPRAGLERLEERRAQSALHVDDRQLAGEQRPPDQHEPRLVLRSGGTGIQDRQRVDVAGCPARIAGERAVREGEAPEEDFMEDREGREEEDDPGSPLRDSH